jgi:hypothetical protein
MRSYKHFLLIAHFTNVSPSVPSKSVQLIGSAFKNAFVHVTSGERK